MKIVFMGTPEFAVGPLKAILAAGHEVAAVVTVPDKASGRGLKINQSDVKKYAVSCGIEVLQPEKLRDEAFLGRLREINADIFVVVAFRMLPEAVWSMPRLGTFNLHTSLLPQYRGAAPINWAVINGEKETGVTTFMLDHEIDTGAILMQRKCVLAPDETFGTLHDKLMEIGSALVVESLDLIARGEAKGKPQSEYGIPESELRSAPKITREVCRIDWSRSAEEIERLVRGLSPYPCACGELENADGTVTAFKLYSAHSSGTDETGVPGTLVKEGKSMLKVQCGKGFLYLDSIQMAGKKRLEIKDFLAGFRNPENCRMV